MTTTKPTYTIEAVICVDAPHLRDGSYKPIRAGTRQLIRYDNLTFRGAVNFYHEILRGEHDCVSEYMAHVVVYRPDRRGVVRRRIYRDRAPGFRFMRLQTRLDHVEHLVLRGHFGEPAAVAGEIVR